MRFRNLSKVQIAIFVLLFCMSAVFGYLFYDSNRTNIRNQEMIADARIENKDLSEDLQIIKDKHSKLQTEVDVLKNKVAKVSFKKKVHKKKRLYAAGYKGKKKYYSKNYRVNYKKLYYQLRNECRKHDRASNYKYKPKTKYKNSYSYRSYR